MASSLPRGLLAGVMSTFLIMEGCSRGGFSSEPQPVSGSLMLDGKPVTVALVEFSQDAEKGEVRSVVARDGRFSMDQDAGLPEGKYSVAVLPFVPELEELSAMAAEERAKITASQNQIPEHYRKRGILTATIEAGVANSIDLKMDSRSR